ncbi:MAG TPA: homoserine kinase [Polyangiaceae bacterium]|jgi:homoserine kinase type II
MAVLTDVKEDDVRTLLAAYGLGALRRLEGIAGGSVNSNFGVEADAGRFFLRLYEERDFAGAERETAMLDRLARAGVETPPPRRRLDGAFVSVVEGKPAAIFPWRDGRMRCQRSVTVEDARRVGEALAHVHRAGAGESCDAGRFQLTDLNRRLDGVEASRDPRFIHVAPRLREAMARVHRSRDAGLPRGLVHSDLFRDNVVWDDGGRIAALLDFESACEGTYAYDLMVTVLAWCVGDDLEPALASAMRQGYESVRPLSAAEKDGLYAEACFGALRFTVTRITDYAMRPEGPGPRVVKDWKRFMKRFEKLEALGTSGLAAALHGG